MCSYCGLLFCRTLSRLCCHWNTPVLWQWTLQVRLSYRSHWTNTQHSTVRCLSLSFLLTGWVSTAACIIIILTSAVDSSQMTASSSTSWSRFSPPSNFVSGHVSTMWFMVCRWPPSQEGDWVRPRMCKLARHGPWPVHKQLSGDYVWWGRLKPGCRIIGSVTLVWLTTEADEQSSLHCPGYCCCIVSVCTLINSSFLDYILLQSDCVMIYWCPERNKSCLTMSCHVWPCLPALIFIDNRSNVPIRCYLKPVQAHNIFGALCFFPCCLQCFDAVSWAAGRASSL